ncbi:MAG: 23S rRNA (pseudouridine(1915)-N(3))-methyltransferase RlmH [Gammaproteobacteria bacterium CG_4_10_14_0_8_um_filter_38_16]|nr:MAG: 23S rRNA (pseudouridine(1915)-N(3))-methyltransferase RlmH [Gammaproteobacteria bacterium CG_4_10_14_0_8_um_filter_38_16]PJA03448.1 MAG: 23S rRNA (pseudouridine(1915)-N(3))-methyltransferase RlmH [Gammaproteobacteria bacterium CG_4_10_14_0_2_um_filter_38_22]PJB10603.1 MAG: 23S rRNA (pseudouridine(1915)-N(3))-methyltransferase RlmH [Gammaproteobacteria bacterium CG_4_9_14_3_um_filter_38_9]PJC38680.1 MAG: 23S rRNA (pseudouridine(1915)-N(3))-methyltransferase RlmH [Candidatus Peregrinibacte
MIIQIIAIGKGMPAWVETGYAEYANRMPADYRVQLAAISAEKRGKNTDIQKIIHIEEAKITATIIKGSYRVALDRTGKTLCTKTLAKQLQTWHDNQQSVCFVIGGPEGLSDDFLKQADAVWSLSEMTLPHPLVRVVLAEQLYRAWSITVNHPYHR